MTSTTSSLNVETELNPQHYRERRYNYTESTLPTTSHTTSHTTSYTRSQNNINNQDIYNQNNNLPLYYQNLTLDERHSLN